MYKASYRLVILIVGLLLFGASPALSQQNDLNRADWETNWSKRSIDLSELRRGGPPKDGIPSIDNPSFVSQEEAAAWLKNKEPVISVSMDGEARAYPLQILIWHEIVNDRFQGEPILVTFCPLCYSALVFNRKIDAEVHSFGVSGLLRHSDLVMFDRKTESLWQQFNGKAIVGDYTGTTLERIPSQIISFAQFKESYPDGKVLSRNTGYSRNYGANPYRGYDDIDNKPFMFSGNTDGRLPPMEKVVGVTIDNKAKTYPYSRTRKERVINDTFAGKPIVVFHIEGATSALDKSDISESKESGSTGVFLSTVDDRQLEFYYDEGQIKDKQTGSTWDITGKAVSGELKGTTLKPVTSGDYFAFAWLVFNPDARIYKVN